MQLPLWLGNKTLTTKNIKRNSMFISILSERLKTEPGQVKRWVRPHPSPSRYFPLLPPALDLGVCIQSHPKYMNLAETLLCNGQLIVSGFPFWIFFFLPHWVKGAVIFSGVCHLFIACISQYLDDVCICLSPSLV